MSLSGYNQMTVGLLTLSLIIMSARRLKTVSATLVIIIIIIISLLTKKTDKKKTHNYVLPALHLISCLSASGLFLLLLLSVLFVSVSHLINFFPDGDILYRNLEVFCIRVSSSSCVWQIVLVRHRLLYSVTYYVKVVISISCGHELQGYRS